MAVLYEKYAFLILVLSTKKWYFSFLKRFSFSRKSVSRLKYSRLSKFPLNVTKKHADLLNGGLV